MSIEGKSDGEKSPIEKYFITEATGNCQHIVLRGKGCDNLLVESIVLVRGKNTSTYVCQFFKWLPSPCIGRTTLITLPADCSCLFPSLIQIRKFVGKLNILYAVVTKRVGDLLEIKWPPLMLWHFRRHNC